MVFFIVSKFPVAKQMMILSSITREGYSIISDRGILKLTFIGPMFDLSPTTTVSQNPHPQSL